MGQQEKRWDEIFRTAGEGLEAVLTGLVCLTAIAGLVGLGVSIAQLALEPPERHPDYMVSITGVDGLNLEATSGGTLSPVFNLTVGIVGGYGYEQDSSCVTGLSTAVVSYGNASLGKGSVPPFCAKYNEVQERMATARGEEVVLPRCLRERLSAELERGEASLDVQVTIPAEACSTCNDKVVVCSKVKIGGSSPSPCLVEQVTENSGRPPCLPIFRIKRLC